MPVPVSYTHLDVYKRQVEDTPVVTMQGRVHYYEGYKMSDVVLPTRLMGMLGAKKILLTDVYKRQGYKFMDYVKAGFPLIIIATVVSMIILPIAFPFFP